MSLRQSPLVNPAGLRTIRGYELREQIGEGGFGVVYRAFQSQVGREVAIKIILPERANQPEFIRRFEVEAQLVARLEHPHIVPLFDYWRDPTGAYLVMRWLRGGSLRDALKEGAIPPETVAKLLDQVAGALTISHRRGVIHRDLKPDNILLDEFGNAYLVDFGIAKQTSLIGSVGGFEEESLSQKLDDSDKSMVLGSPMYMSPEQINGDVLTPQTDLYSLGIVLYELLTGKKPVPRDVLLGELIKFHLEAPVPLISTEFSDIPAAVDTVIQKATDKIPAARYTDALTMAIEFRKALSGLLGASGLSSALTVDALVQNPYKGLRAFQEADARDFFGRDVLVDQLLKRLVESGEDSRFMAVVGPSGSGKSSVVRAGLIPALRRGVLPGSNRWYIVEMTPGSDPLAELRTALLKVATSAPTGISGLLSQNDQGLFELVEQVLPGQNSELVFVIDQFEELFTLVSDEAVRVQFIDSIARAVSDPRSRLRVIVTLRADFYDRPLMYASLGRLMRARTEVVLPLQTNELVRAIIDPAKRVGVSLEPGLADTIIQDVGEQPGTLPLLQYALTELFENRQGRVLTREAYKTSGGVLGTLVYRADELYHQLSSPEQKAARQMFLRLVTLGDGTDDTRRRVFQLELVSVIDDEEVLGSILESFGKSRLLAFDRDLVTRTPTVEIAHEALIRAWKLLRGWLDDSREAVQTQRRLSGLLEDWHTSHRDPSFLASGVRLEQFEQLIAAGDLALTPEEINYVKASVVERERQVAADRAREQRELELARQTVSAQQRAANRLRYLLAVVLVFLVVAIGLAGIAVQRTTEASAALKQSEAQRLASEANNLLQLNRNAETAALLAIRSVTTQYSTQGDAALAGAAVLNYPAQLFSGHTDGLTSVAISPDSTHILTGSSDHTARLWDAKTGLEIRRFVGHSDAVTSVAFSPDGKMALTGSTDKTARAWDVNTGLQLRVFIGHSDSITSVAFSPDSKTVLTGSADKSARLWDAKTGSLLFKLIGHTAAVTSVAFAPDGQTVVTGSDDATATLWDVHNGSALRQLSGHTDRVKSVAFAPDSQTIATGSADGTIRIWSASLGVDLQRLDGHTDAVTSVTFSPDGKSLLSGSADTSARLWDVRNPLTVRVFAAHDGLVASVAFAPNGSFFVTGSIDKTARTWLVSTSIPTLAQFIGHTARVTAAVFSPDGQQVLTASNDKTARLWDVHTGQLLYLLAGHNDVVTSAAFSPDGTLIVTGSADNAARIWDAKTGTTLHVLTGHSAIVNGVAFSPDGQTVATASADRSIRLWDVQSGALQKTLFGHANSVTSVVFSPDGKHLLTGSVDKTAWLWNVQVGAQEKLFVGHTGTVTSVDFSPDGQMALTGGTEGMARLWSVDTGKLIRTLTGHIGAVESVAFAPDGKTLITGSADKTARIWDTATGLELRRLSWHSSDVDAVSFSPDGKFILTGSYDKFARLWDVDYHTSIQTLCARLLRDFSMDEQTLYGVLAGKATCSPASSDTK
jgi:WD40 repeat protein/serine/threonine protein kinase